MAQVLNDETFSAFVSASTVPVLVDFYRDGCVPCRRVAPLLSRAGEKYADRLAVVRVNIALSPGLVQQYAIEAAPTLAVFQNGEEVARHRGVIDAAGLETLIRSAIE